MKSKVIILIYLIFLLCDFSYSQRYDGNKLVEDMKEYEKKERGEGCSFYQLGCYVGYVLGVVATSDGVFFTTPSGSTNGQLYAIVAKYLNENPEKWSEPAHDLVLYALQKAFPLKN